MTDHDRGAYTPQTDAPLSFDARRAPGGGRPVPMTLMISGMVLVILLIGVVYFYRSGVRQANQAPQVIGAPVGATKAPPPSSEQPSDAAAGLQVYKSEAAPASEAQGSVGQQTAAAPQAAPKFTPAPEQPEPRPAPRATPAPAPAVAAKPAPVKPTPAPVAVKAASKPPAVKPAPTPAPAASAPAGGAMVQIGAFSSAALADKGWSDTAKVLPGAMAGKTKSVQVVQKGGATFYRTSVAGFASRADAMGFCASLKAVGKSCIVK
jgi:outer membrane biosynthesis protein TonB